MARLVKYIIALIVLAVGMPTFASGTPVSLSTLITAQNIPFETCYRVFNIDNVNLFYQTVASINANRFNIDEVQSKSGYVLFTAVNKQFLATVVNVNTNQGMLRITPVDGNYYFQPGIVLNIFKYIEMNINKKPSVVSITD